MRRSVLIDGIETVRRDLEESGIIDMADQALASRRDNSAKNPLDWFSFSAIQNYLVATANYSDAERKITEISGVSKFRDPEFWQNIVKEPDPSALFQIRSAGRFAVDILPKFSDLLRQEHKAEIKGNSAHLPPQIRGKQILTIVLAEDDNEFSAPSRVIKAIEGLELLYEVHAILEGFIGNDLIILSCDSGSDKSFDFLGISTAIAGVRGTISDIWDRRVYHRHNQMSATIDVISRSLPVVEKLTELAKNGSMDPSQAEQLKRKIKDGTTKLLESGTTTDEMYELSSFSPRELMRPEPKLLAAPTGEIQSKEEDHEFAPKRAAEPQLSPEEVRQLKELMSRASEAENAPIQPANPQKRPRTKRT